MNQFLTHERTRIDRIPQTLHPQHKLYLLKTRLSNYISSNWSLDTISNRGYWDPDPEYHTPHRMIWPPPDIREGVDLDLPLEFLKDALIDEAYQIEPGNAYNIHKKYLRKLVEQQLAPENIVSQTYPKYVKL